MSARNRRIKAIVLLAIALLCAATWSARAAIVAASASLPGFAPECAVDHERFSVASAWKGPPGATSWWWQIDFEAPRPVGAILQVAGDHPFVFRHAPTAYQWQWSADGASWHALSETSVTNEQRAFRVLRLNAAVQARFLRISIAAAAGYPALRELEFYAATNEVIRFPDWIVAVNSTHDPALPNEGQQFIPLARSCDGWAELQAQQIWVNDFAPEFLAAEPRPLCAFLSGSFKDWCEIDRRAWRGAERVLKSKSIPMWASCGGAQALALLSVYGADQAWDCPHCRDPKNPKTPLYTHIGHTATRPCGDYSGCVFERGPNWIRATGSDPAFTGLPREFQAVESHCGQIEWAPAGWSLIATAGEGTKTKTQCLRVNDFPIYAAQFHIELDGAPVTSKQIMGNFLTIAKSRRGAR